MSARCHVTVALAAALLAGCGSAGSPAVATPTQPAVAHRHRDRAPDHRHDAEIRATHTVAADTTIAAAPPAARGTVLAAVQKLTVKGRAPKTGYSREQFGDGWIDTDGCDIRNRILTRDLSHKTYLNGCRVASGSLDDPYTASQPHPIHPRRLGGRHRPRRRALGRVAEGRAAVARDRAGRVRQ